MEQKPDVMQEVRQALRVTRLIVFALAMGVSIFIGFVLVTEPPAARERPILWLVMAIFAGVVLVARLVVPEIIFRYVRGQIARGTWQPNSRPDFPAPVTDSGQLMAGLQTKIIVGIALLEAAAFGNAYAYMAERQLVSLAVTLTLILMIVAHFPLRFWLDGWLERQKRWLDEERSLHPTSDR